MADGERDLEDIGRVVGASLMAFVLFVVAAVLFLFPLGEIYDSDCGTLLQRPPTRGQCADKAVHRRAEIAVVGVVAVALFSFAVYSSRRRPQVVAGGLLTLAVVAALLLVAAPFAVTSESSAPTRVGKPFDLHCPGRFTEYGGDEHPPPGTEQDCGKAANRRLAFSVGIVGIASAASVFLIRRGRRSTDDQSSSDATIESTSASGAVSSGA